MFGPIVGNVLITFDFKVIEDLFFNNVSIEDVKKNPNTFIFSNKRDKSFIRFKHTLGLEGNVSDFSIEFLDPTKDFEKIFIDRSIFSIIKNLATEVTKEVNEEDLSREIPIAENYKPDTTLKPTIVTAERLPLEIKAEDVKTFISYGVGPDTKKWAGPFATEFLGADLKVNSEGVRILTIRFVPSLNPLMTTKGIYGQPIIENSRQGIKRVSSIVPLDLKPVPGTLGKDLETQKNFKFHPVLRDLVTEYLQKSTATNQVLVLLPDVDKTQTTWFDTLKSNTPDTSKNPVGSDFLSTIVEEFLLSLKPEFGLRTREQLNQINIDIAVNDYITKVFSNFGIKVGGELTSYLTRSPGIHSKMRAENKFGNKPVAVMESGPEETGEDTGVIDYMEAINKFIAGYNDSVYYTENMVIWQENNINILNLWKQYKIIEDATRPVVVFGDKRLIEILLYGLFITLKEQDAEAISQMNKDDFLKIYRGEGFLRQVQRAVIPLGEDIYNYGETDFDEDILALTKEVAKVFSVPIFRTNVKNPNVLEYNVAIDNSYFTALMMAIKLQAAHPSIRTQIENRKSATEIYNTWQDLEGIINKWKESGKDDIFIEEKLTGKLEEYGRLYPSEIPKIAKMALLVYNKMYDGNLPTLYVDERTGKNPLNAQLEVVHQLLRQSWKVSLKTLPYFKISSPHHIQFPAILIGKQPSVVGTDLDSESVDSFFTGLYFINGYEHIIGTDGIYSNFSITKYIKSSVSQQDTGGGTERFIPIEESLLNSENRGKSLSISEALNPNNLFK